MNPNILPTDVVGIVDALDPVSQAAATVTTGWIDAKKFLNFLAIVAVGALGASATVNAKLEQATSSGGAGAKDITGKAITALTQAGTDSNKQALINLHQSELDVQGGFTHFRLSVTVGVAASLISATVLGANPAQGVASDHDDTSVDEIIA